MKYKRKKLINLERHRTSIFIDDLTECYFCPNRREDIHEILYGSNRINSMKYGYTLPLCREHHEMFHNNHELTRRWSAKCQRYFEKEHTREEWIAIFHRNYID